MDNLISKFKGDNSKKQIENIVIFIILLIIVIIVINSLFSEEKNNSQMIVTEAVNIANSNDEFENKLQKILSNFGGVSNVNVMVSYSNSITKIPMIDIKENTKTIEEQDVNGGKRKTEEVSNEQSIVFEETGGSRTPAIKQTTMPEIVGVIVTAEGVESQVIKENIKNAVEAVTGLSANRIQIFAK